MSAPRLCLNMIVKNESRIIERLIQSVLPIIDSYCICDTGSTDDTPAIIQRVMEAAGKPGEVVYEPFKDFGYNRTFALKAAKPWGEFALLVDADMRLVIEPTFSKDILKPDLGAVSIVQRAGDMEYYNVRIVNLHIGVTCVCPTHEYYNIPGGYRQERIKSLWINDIGDGGSKADKFERDIRLLKEGLETDPNNPRYHFYLANSYFNSGRPAEAIPHYKRRVEIGGWHEEIFYSCLQLGHCYERTGDHANMLHWWVEGFNRHNGRAESLYQIVKHYRFAGKHKMADAFCQLAQKVPYPVNDVLFVQSNVYKYDLDYEASILAYYTGRLLPQRRYMELISANRHAQNLISNYKFYARKLKDMEGVISHNFSGTEVRSVAGRTDSFVASSPCIIPHGDGYLLNVRYVNYLIEPNGSYSFKHNDGKITTINRTFWLDRNLHPTREHWFDAIARPELRYQGVEDVRIIERGGQIVFGGTVQDPTTGKLRMGTGVYNTGNNRLEAIPQPSPEGRDCEKNWSYFHDASGALRAIYDWSPLRIIEDVSANIIKTDSAVPGFFRHLRGSTNGVRVGDEIWFMTHFVEYATPRHYYHIIITLDANTLAYKRHSIPFKFRGDSIEYALGLVVEDDRVLISHSTWDRSAAIMEVPRRIVDDVLFEGA